MHGAKRVACKNIVSNWIFTVWDCYFVREMELMKNNNKSEYISKPLRYALRSEEDVVIIITVYTRTWIVGSLVTYGVAFGGLWIPFLTLGAPGVIIVIYPITVIIVIYPITVITEIQICALPVKQKEWHVTSYTEHDTWSIIDQE